MFITENIDDGLQGTRYSEAELISHPTPRYLTVPVPCVQAVCSLITRANKHSSSKSDILHPLSWLLLVDCTASQDVKAVTDDEYHHTLVLASRCRSCSFWRRWGGQRLWC